MKDSKKHSAEEAINEKEIINNEESGTNNTVSNDDESAGSADNSHSNEKRGGHKHSEKNWELMYEEQKDKYLRLAAEFDNYRKRSAKERLDLISVAAEDTIKGLLPVVDDMERAIKVLSESGADSSIVEGEELIFKKLTDYLKSRGLAEIEALDKELDTDFHEAVAQFPVEEANRKNRIIDVVKKGYTLNGKVIRFAQVVVGI